jgi:hypothetical protein
MKRTFNYTGRHKIERKHVSVALRREVAPMEFDAALDLEAYKFPSDAEVVVEAYYRSSSSYMRFRFGTAGRIEPPTDRRLTEIDGEMVFFRVKVIDTSDARKTILGLAEQIEPGDTDLSPGSRFNLLPVNFLDLKNEVWNLRLDPRAILEVNGTIPGIRDLVHNGVFFGCVYPEVVRKVLAGIHVKFGIDDDVDAEWAAMWLRYARTFAEIPEAKTDDSIAEWIELVVDGFAGRHRLKDMFAAASGVLQ